MFANRFTALVDACALAGALKRNLILTLAEAEFFRLRWSGSILDETQRAIAEILEKKGADGPDDQAARARAFMEQAFEEAMVSDFDSFLCACKGLPDPDDAHVIAAALKTRAEIIVTDNLKDFPADLLAPLNLDVRSSDAFIADAIALDPGKAVAAIKRMRLRFKKPEKTPDLLLLDMEASGLVETVDMLRPYTASL
ncbi:PIN domain-containing protein [Methylobacterium nigriterrae]|uniref:PIN domain-containing protein n=1 Tax=Methylobacterium nigriterrae TaxID=3127512 RepID=UPI0030134466